MIMRSFVGLLCAAVVLGLAAPVWAVAGNVPLCIGTESGDWGGPLGTTYCYEIYVDPDDPLTSFAVGDHTGSCPNLYVVDEAGQPVPDWTGACGQPGSEPDYFDKTPHGSVSLGPSGACPAITLWQGPALSEGLYYFGHSSPLDSHDVGWTITLNSGTTIDEDWDQEVGWGSGPVHAPIPEPATLGLLAIGGFGVLKRRRWT